jgi:hypothetical protein
VIEEEGFAKVPMSEDRIGMLEKMCHDAFLNITGREPITALEHAAGYMSVASTALMACVSACDDDTLHQATWEVRDVASRALVVLEKGS